MGITAERVRIKALDASQIHRLGFRIVDGIIPSDSTVDEKGELLGRQLQVEKDETIEYRINGRAASVIYSILDIQPPNASEVGKTTIIEIEGETQNDNHTTSPSNGSSEQEKFVRRAQEKRLEFLMQEIDQWKKEGLNVGKLEAQAESLEKQL